VKVYNLQEAQGKGKREATVVLVTGGRTGPTPIQNTAVWRSGSSTRRAMQQIIYILDRTAEIYLN
jgi:hypothetical protein